MKFNVPVTVKMFGQVEIEARDIDDLIDKLNSPDYMLGLEIPDEMTLLRNSIEADFEGIQ